MPERVSDTIMPERASDTIMPERVSDTLAIQRLVLDFALRDHGRWDALQALFVPGAAIHVSWYHGAIEGFVAASRRLAEAGAPAAKHLIATPRVDIAGRHAVSETDIVIMVRLPVPGGEVDVSSWARFHDRFVRQEGRWRIAGRIAVYEKDRVDPVGATRLGEGWSTADLARYPAAYKHLAKLLEQIGRPIVSGTVVAGTPEEQVVFRDARDWLVHGTLG
jgi:hypothetical protein